MAVLTSSSSNTTSCEASEVEEMPGSSRYVLMPKRARQIIMSPGLASALDHTKMSDRKAAFVILEITKSLGVDIANFNINRTSIFPGCKGNRIHFAVVVKWDFTADLPLVVDWDGKLMEELTTEQNVDRLPILVLGGGTEKLVGVHKLPGGGAGENQASIVVTRCFSP